MNEFLDKFLKLKPAIKVAITLVLMLAIAGGYYSVFYSELENQIRSAEQHMEQLKTEKVQYEKRKAEYMQYRSELNDLLEQKRELLKALPSKAEIATFIQNIQEQAGLAGLEVLQLSIDSEIPQELYVRIPVRMEVKGTYLQVMRFFKNVSELRRIVNIENLSLAPERVAGQVKLRARFVAATFRYNETAGEPQP